MDQSLTVGLSRHLVGYLHSMYLLGIEKGYSFNVGLHIQLLYDDDRVTEKYIHFTDI